MAGVGSLAPVPPRPPRGGPPARRPPDVVIPPRRVDDLPDDVPPLIEGPDNAPRIEGPDAPRDGRWDGNWDEVPTPWYKDPLTIVPGAMVGGLGYLWHLMTQDGSGVDDTSGTADLHAEQAPLPGSGRPMDLKARAAAGNPDAQRYLQRQQEGKDRFRQMAMWAGGGQNLGRHNIGFYNMLYDMPPEDRKQVIKDMMPMDPNRAIVEAQSSKRAAELAQRAVEGMVGRTQGPLQQAAAEAQLGDTERALLHKADRQIHPSEIKVVDDYVSANFSKPMGIFGTSSYFTIQERQDTINWLIDQGYDPAKAQRLVDHVARMRESQDWS